MSSDRELIDLFKVWLGDTRCLKFTGVTRNYKKLRSFPLVIFQAFAADIDRELLQREYTYQIRTVAGALSSLYPQFRDRILLQGLREYRAERLGVAVCKVPEMRYMHKSETQTHGIDREVSPRCVLEWQAVRPIVPGMSRGNLGGGEERPVEDALWSYRPTMAKWRAAERPYEDEEPVAGDDDAVTPHEKGGACETSQPEYGEVLCGLFAPTSLPHDHPFYDEPPPMKKQMKKRKRNQSAPAPKKRRVVEPRGVSLWAFAPKANV